MLQSFSRSVPAPPYSAPTGVSERISRVISSGTSQQYVYSSKHLELCLGQALQSMPLPTYGKNATIEGWVRIKTCERVVRVDVTLEGQVMAVLMDRGLPSTSSKKHLLNMTTTLYRTGDSSPCSLTKIPFSMSIPTYVQGGTEVLPPSFAASHVSMVGDVKYTIRVDMVRKGLSTHQSLKTKILYLPRSTPPPPRYLSPLCEVTRDSWKMAVVRPIDDRKSPFVVGFGLPSPFIYTVQQPVPFLATLRGLSTSSDAELHLASRNIAVSLIRLVSLQVSGRRSIRETVIGTGQLHQIDRQESGERIVRGCVAGGQAEGESSWKIDGFISVKYFIEMTIRPPKDIPSLEHHFPHFRHRESVQITTHNWNVDDVDGDCPALGLHSHVAPTLLG